MVVADTLAHQMGARPSATSMQTWLFDTWQE